MSREISISAAMTAIRTSGGSVAATVSGAASFTADLASDELGSAIQSIASGSVVALTIPGTANPDYLFVKNTSAVGSGNLHLYLDSGGTQRFATLKPGEGFPIPAPDTSIYAAATTGTVVVFTVAANAT